MDEVEGHIVRVKTQEVQGYHLQDSEHHVDTSVYHSNRNNN
jgi:hypothetical protein